MTTRAVASSLVGAGPVGVGVVGCGTISAEYLRSLTSFPDLAVLGCADVDLERARRASERFGVPAAADIEALLGDPRIEIVVNLTPPAEHAGVALATLLVGKHTYGEKPLALETDQAQLVLRTAAERRLRVGSAPDTFLGPGLQQCLRLVEAGEIGEPLSALACYQDPGPEHWHPNPDFLYRAGGGPLLDLAPYYLTALVQLLGRVSRVAATAVAAWPERTIGSGPRTGVSFTVEVPTHVTALLEFESGPVATTVWSFDSPMKRHGFVEVTGTDATLRLPDPNQFAGPSYIRRRGDTEWHELTAPGFVAGRGVGVLELARAIRTGAEHRASGELAAHIVDVMSGIAESSRDGTFVPVRTTFTRPAPLPIAWSPADNELDGGGTYARPDRR